MVPQRKVIFGLGLALVGAGLALFISFLVRQGAERASWWATILGLLVSVVGLIVSVMAWRRPIEPPACASKSVRDAAELSARVDAAEERASGPSSRDVTASGDGAVGWAVGSTVVTGKGNVVNPSRDGRS